MTNPPFATMTDHDPHGIDQHQPGARLDALKPRPALARLELMLREMEGQA
jgi:hypothetical protein